ncbi:MAG: LysR family transcriptional regulator [Alicyclobacillus macrosporangiidus]|uniref:LysR family transcriptional regulator n=1 Tax=Alicyclobacillus macrosporangiidus TaxID=392015 RepID=UPI0026F287B2|nr:LysR family transcriptional regulator [Alicyclobacillus macrosporangiidus]MCL6597785.1 LysR family transcriptional regulator [Alicyclobacillus macrosporangiidus]
MDTPLEVFIAVVERRSFSRAADELHMTQPAVSQHIRVLEEYYGVKLVERRNRFIRLTKAGEVLYAQAKRIVREYAQARRLLEDLTQKVQGPLRIGASLTFGEYVLPRVLARFRRVYPDVQPEVIIANTRHVADQVLARELDVGIVEAELCHPELEVTPFLPDTMRVILPVDHPLASAERVEASALSGETWIVREQGSGTREMADRLLAQAGIRPRAVMAFGSNQIIKESVEAGLGVALLSERALGKELALGTLACLEIAGHPVRRWFSTVVHASQFRTRTVDVFLAHLRSCPDVFD